jgi:hypothetical protein
MGELVPRNDARKLVGIILTRVDQRIKGGELEKALLEVESAERIDPDNVYVQDYRRKIRRLREALDDRIDERGEQN